MPLLVNFQLQKSLASYYDSSLLEFSMQSTNQYCFSAVVVYSDHSLYIWNINDIDKVLYNILFSFLSLVSSSSNFGPCSDNLELMLVI